MCYLSQGRNNYYTIVPVREMEGKDGKPAGILFGSIGFEIRNKDGKAVAAVSKLDKGVVYMQAKDAEERFLLANVCAALLMQEVIARAKLVFPVNLRNPEVLYLQSSCYFTYKNFTVRGVFRYVRLSHRISLYKNACY